MLEAASVLSLRSSSIRRSYTISTHDFAEAAQPITVRGIAYKLFVANLIASMAKNETARVSRLLKIARAGHHPLGVDCR
jgi:hypothetical protein